MLEGACGFDPFATYDVWMVISDHVFLVACISCLETWGQVWQEGI